jgi:hypothetical protein
MRMETITRHNPDCRRAFSRRDENCPRCQELAQGAAPRRGWGQSRFNGARERHPVRAHVCRPECGVVCTFGEW